MQYIIGALATLLVFTVVFIYIVSGLDPKHVEHDHSFLYQKKRRSGTRFFWFMVLAVLLVGLVFFFGALLKNIFA